MSISPLLSIARSALAAHEAALAVAGRNVANAATPGYTRLTVALGAREGGGVEVVRIVRVVDSILARRLLAAETARRESETLRDRLGALAAALNELDEPSLGSTLAGFFDAAAALARNPGGLAERQALLARAGGITAELNRRAAAVADQQRDADARVLAAVGRANDALARVATLNRTIVAAEAAGEPASELRDERDQALGELAGLLGISVTEDAQGAVTVATANGTTLVAGPAVFHRLAVREGAIGLDGRPLHEVGITGAANEFISVPAAFAHGELAALAELRDERLPAAAAALDVLARALRDAVNGLQTHPDARDLDGLPTGDAPLFAGEGAADLAVVLDDPRRIAADGGIAIALAALGAGPVPALGGSFTEWLAAWQVGLGEDAAHANDLADANAAFSAQLEGERAALSGVNLDEELANIVASQRAFEAAARMAQIADAMLEDLLGILG